MNVICVLPARISSTRIPRKPLQEIAGRPLLEWCWRAASKISLFDQVVVATDSEEIEKRAKLFDAEVMITSSNHKSGTDRVEEVSARLGVNDDDVVVNFQADEPFVDTDTVKRAILGLQDRSSALAEVANESNTTTPGIATLAAPIRDREEWESPGIVKVVTGSEEQALYFSRSPIPAIREGPTVFDAGSPFLRHIGIYACRRPALRQWARGDESRLERTEKLEQLRELELGMRIHVEVGPWTEPGIDLPADLERAERLLSQRI